MLRVVRSNVPNWKFSFMGRFTFPDKIDGTLATRLVQVVLQAFSVSELDEVVFKVFDQRLSEIVSTKAGTKDIAAELIDWTVRRGMLSELFNEAYDARPRNPGMRRLDDDFGLKTLEVPVATVTTATPGATPRPPQQQPDAYA